MLIPLRHENMHGRRWPIITFVLIGLNFLVFLLTHSSMEAEQSKRVVTRVHLLILAATHPELKTTTPEATAFIEHVKKTSNRGWEGIASPHRPPQDVWDTQIRLEDDPRRLQEEMDTLCQDFQASERFSLVERYGFVPAHPAAISYLTANFLHGGWLHLIGNMWFLWLAGFILEDHWGRPIYAAFYLLAGVASLQFYAWCSPGSFTSLVGASGAVAALMGAFLVRFPKLKIEMAFFVVLFYRVKFKAPAYWLLPLWLFMEFFYGAALGARDSIAHWAHVGGFLFGMLGAFIIQNSGLEQKASAEIDSKIGWAGDPEVVRAQEALEQGKVEEAVSILEKHVAAKPDSTDALTILQQVQWRRNNTEGYFQATLQLLQAYLKARNLGPAWQAYEEFSNAGGQRIPPAAWLELIRHLENLQEYSRAVAECDKLSQAFPKERPSLMALLAAGRISLKNLNRPEDALRYYKAADASAVPHLDWEANIKAGISNAERALGAVPAPVPGCQENY